jgi:acyl carrier protein
MQDKIQALVFSAIDEINQNLLPAQQLEKSLNTALSGPEAKLDSMNLLNFIMEVEKNYEEAFSTSVSLTDEGLLSQHADPFKSVNTLIEYLTIIYRAG